jgi:predicted flap endonuclease-1-like 5' DNA nuclease
MNLLFRVLRAAHARGTHHKLALDALQFLTITDGELWQRMLLKHVEAYMTGAKAPDDEFKDFKNHVLHPRDNYWGGAPEQAEAWYNTLVTELRAERWPEAARAAGILSHYLSDPLHPFHTAQSEAENNIHRAVEWSINRAYDGLWKEAMARLPDPAIRVSGERTWLRELVCTGADRSNASYESLIAHYAISVGVVDPPAGLDPFARRLVGDLLVAAAHTIALVLSKAIAEAAVRPPQVALTLDTVLATLAIPMKALQNRLDDQADRTQVELMHDELTKMGRVELTLPEDDRAVRDQHAIEVLRPKKQERLQARAARIAAGGRPGTMAASTRPEEQEAEIEIRRTSVPAINVTARPPDIAAPRPAAVATDPPPLPPHAAEAAPLTTAEDAILAAATSASAMPPAPIDEATAPAPIAQSIEASAPEPELEPEPTIDTTATNMSAEREGRRLRSYLSPGDHIEAAPSIGPKMAERLATVGVMTVADLLAGDPDALAAGLQTRSITGQVVRNWQDQARMVCKVPGLRGLHSQLLVGAGYRTVEAIAAADAGKLCADVLTFATTSEGNRILRDGPPPDIERVKTWAEWVRSSLAA